MDVPVVRAFLAGLVVGFSLAGLHYLASLDRVKREADARLVESERALAQEFGRMTADQSAWATRPRD